MYKLEISYDFDFDLIGIVSAERCFKLAWQLNQLLGIHLVRQENLEMEYVDGSILKIAKFEYKTENDVYQLLKNRADWFLNTAKPFLLPELKEYDYFVRIDNATKVINIEAIKDAIAQLPLVQYCIPIDLSSLKDKENLIF